MTRVPDDVYAQQYLQECQVYVAEHTPDPDGKSPGVVALNDGCWVTTKATTSRPDKWVAYADQYGPLKAVQPDGSTREWDYRELFR